MRCRARSLREYHLRSYVNICRKEGAGHGPAPSRGPTTTGLPQSPPTSGPCTHTRSTSLPGPCMRQESWRGTHEHPGAQIPCPALPRAHLEMFEAQLAAEELMLLPHVLLQVPKEAEWRQLRALWALMLKQLPGETPRPPDPAGTQCRRPERALAPPTAPACTPGAGARWTGAPTTEPGLLLVRTQIPQGCRMHTTGPNRGPLPHLEEDHARDNNTLDRASSPRVRAQLPGTRVRLTGPREQALCPHPSAFPELPRCSVSLPPQEKCYEHLCSRRRPRTGPDLGAAPSPTRGWAHPQQTTAHRPLGARVEDPSHLYKAKTFPSAK